MAKGGERILRRLVVRMVVAAAVAGAAALLFSRGLEDRYRARVLLNLAPMPFKQSGEAPKNLAILGDPAAHVSYLTVHMQEALSMPDYTLVLTSEEMATRLCERLPERFEAAGWEPIPLSIGGVRGALDVRSKILLQTADKVEYQRIVELLVTWDDPKVAAVIANEWASQAIEMATAMRTAGREGAVELLEEQLNQAWARFDDAHERIEILDGAQQIDGLARRLAETESAITSYQVQQARLSAEMGRLEKQIARLDEEIARAAAAPEQSREDGAASAAVAKGGQVREELTRVRSLTASELAGAQGEQEALAAILVEWEPRAVALRAELARANKERATFELQARTSEKRIEEMSRNLDAMHLSAADTVPEFKLASSAVPPSGPIGPHRSLLVATVVCLAAAGAVVHFFGMIALRRYARMLEMALEE